MDAQQPPQESRTAPARRRCGVDDRRSACKPPRVSKRVHADEIAADREQRIGQRRDRGDHRVFDEVERRVARVAPACARDDARKRKHHARRHADEALRLGLANWVAAPEDLAARTREIALRLAGGPTVAYRYMKENLNRAMAGNVEDCLDLEATHHVHCGQTEDHREATKAFVDKREPVFKGR